jgi:hypothetical protein
MIKTDNRRSSRNAGEYIALLWPFLLIIIVFLSTVIAAGNAEKVEKIYSGNIYPVISQVFSFISRRVPFSLWDIFWVLVIILLLTGFFLMLFRRIRFGWFARRFICLGAILYAFFYVSWGYNYFRPDIGKRLSWDTTVYDEPRFRSVLDSLIYLTRRNHIVIKASDYSLFDSLVERSYAENSHLLKIRYPNGTRRPKTMTFSSLFVKSGVSGYFGPFFNEIHLNGQLLPMDYPFVLAHEKAHQFGITSEAEANLYAFVICINSGDQRLKYSASQSLLLYFLRDASKMKDYHEILKKIDEKVIGDLRFRQEYYSSLQNEKLSEMQETANDVYLKANKVEDGVMNYDRVVALLLNWYDNAPK